ncbi:MAG: hypothetical protein Q7R33_06095 [Nitrosarchaeum sp.]|nr:hypothetical protein [Nitrosarchaeum sp.]
MNHFATISTEFLTHIAARRPWWSGKKFRHPETNNKVNFKSLPLEEQRRLNEMYKSKIQGKQEKMKAQLLRREERTKRRKEKAKVRTEAKQQKKNITPESHPNFFTDNGKRLSTTHGFWPNAPVQKNPAWDAKTDNTYYALQKNPKTGRPLHYYTENYIVRHEKQKFANNQRFGEKLPDIRKKYQDDLKSTDERNRTYATAVALIDKAAMRIGNKKSEQEREVRGLHNLQVKHMNIKNNSIELAYTGKDKVEQKHTFTVDDTIKKNLMDLIHDKSPDQPIFTWHKRGEEIRIAPRQANRYLRERLGSNVTIHHFRHYHGSRIAKEFLDSVDASKMNKSQIKDTIRDSQIAVSEYLGNTPNVARKHYIDPTIFKMFLARAKMKKALADAMQKTAAFTFDVSSTEGVNPQENKFLDDLGATKLEDLEQFDSIDFENTDIDAIKI